MDSVVPFLPAAEEYGAQIDRPEAIVDFFEPHRFGFERVTEEERLAVEFHPATGRDAAHFEMAGILDRRQGFRIGT